VTVPGRVHRTVARVGLTGLRAVAPLMAIAAMAGAEPVVVSGAAVPGLLGTPLRLLRVTDLAGAPIPFQVDELVGEGEYVCP
jgi:hypothetical protein